MDEILSVDHIIDSEFKQFEEYQHITIEAIEDENGNDVTDSSEFDINELNEGVHTVAVDKEFTTKAISGQQLEDAPVMSCLVPDYAENLSLKPEDTKNLTQVLYLENSYYKLRLQPSLVSKIRTGRLYR